VVIHTVVLSPVQLAQLYVQAYPWLPVLTPILEAVQRRAAAAATTAAPATAVPPPVALAAGQELEMEGESGLGG